MIGNIGTKIEENIINKINAHVDKKDKSVPNRDALYHLRIQIPDSCSKWSGEENSGIKCTTVPYGTNNRKKENGLVTKKVDLDKHRQL